MSVPKSVTELVKGSGNNFHSKVARWFQANDWHTVVSPYYMDQTQAKARELDWWSKNCGISTVLSVNR